MSMILQWKKVVRLLQRSWEVGVSGICAGFGEFFDRGEECFAVVSVCVDTFLYSSFLCGSDEVLVCGDGGVEGCVVSRGITATPSSLEPSAGVHGGQKWCFAEGGGEFVFGSLVPASVRIAVGAVVFGGFGEGEVDGAVVGPM
ncbi:hypothetical protein NDU88_002437 [Pleurodeles waltl]|uniref:Uncharacterized protein n=1 Tax=Pleurodeles waltl TaxID=8319 RepID=A0AAV7U9A7_PLEWA|nr:hypothetical protein NDU88_002437 [Pleurodeles waltl]